MSYDAGRKAYTYHSENSMGSVIFVRGQVDGRVWTWSDDVTMEGKTMKIRAIVTEESPTAYSFKLEAGDGGSMILVEEGRATKVKKSTTP